MSHLNFKKPTSVLSSGISVALMLLSHNSLNAQTVTPKRLVGYIPSYANIRTAVDKTNLTQLTHINLAFLNPNANGVVATSNISPVCMQGPTGANISASDIAYVVNKAKAAGTKISIALAGGVLPACSGNWQTLLQSTTTRATLVKNIASFVNTSKLDGVDVDIEGNLLNNLSTSGLYTTFVKELRAALPGKIITSATASYVGGEIPVSSFPYFDFVNIMSYDNVGPGWGTVGTEHSPYSMAQSNVQYWLNKGLAKSKLVLGVPFYGYGFNGRPTALSFNDIINQYGVNASQTDVVGTLCNTCAYITYNGIPTIKQKTSLALQQGSGIMIWELNQDATGVNAPYNLVSAIRSVMGPR